jgi:hypothetical protein
MALLTRAISLSSQPVATKLMAAAISQSVAITCAQIATIPKNIASEASVAISSTMARPIFKTPSAVDRCLIDDCQPRLPSARCAAAQPSAAEPAQQPERQRELKRL